MKNHAQVGHGRNWFSRFSRTASRYTGRPVGFALALVVVLLWLASGPLFGFSDTWQLVINTGTTIVTFLMVFLIQSSQNRDTEALQIKLDELIRATKGAHNAVLDLEELDEETLDRVRARYSALARRAREEVARGKSDVGTPKVGVKED
jgi:low affinity Fe/Cu permease